jgi:hypothetical protein
MVGLETTIHSVRGLLNRIEIGQEGSGRYVTLGSRMHRGKRKRCLFQGIVSSPADCSTGHVRGVGNEFGQYCALHIEAVSVGFREPPTGF